MQPIYLVCGVPGSGKTWVCRQLMDKFLYVPHDSFAVEDYAHALLKAASGASRPIIGEVPFRISVLVDELLAVTNKVRPFFVIESPSVTKARYEAREGKPIPKQHLTRIDTVVERAYEFGRPMGTSNEILKMLQEEKI